MQGAHVVQSSPRLRYAAVGVQEEPRSAQRKPSQPTLPHHSSYGGIIGATGARMEDGVKGQWHER